MATLAGDGNNTYLSDFFNKLTGIGDAQVDLNATLSCGCQNMSSIPSDSEPAFFVNQPTVLKAKRRLLRMHFESGVGHIGGNLSALDAMLHLHCEVMDENDLFVLSKGHAAGALYVTLWAQGLINDEQLSTFHKDDTFLAAHPAAHWHRHILFATGSLGHGLGLAAGAALGKRLRRQDGTVFCLLSDGECEEGSIWEALLFAHHQKLANLVALVDANGLQGFGSTREVASLEPLADKLRGLGLSVLEIDGHSPAALSAALVKRGDGPQIIVLRTVKGHGVSFMEGKMEWHYLPLVPEQYEQALRELGE